MFSNRKQIVVVAPVLLLALGLGTLGCGGSRPALGEGGSTRPGAGEGTTAEGAIGLALQVTAGIALDSVGYTITSPGGFLKTGVIDVGHSATISAVISGIPAGPGYTISITAATAAAAAAQATTCAGTGTFDITAHTTTAVTVHLTCHEGSHTGGVSVTGTINVCPIVDGVSANPADVVVGGSVALAAAAHDSDAGPAALSYQWSASGGTVSDATAAAPRFTCVVPGPVTLTVSVGDGDATPGCNDVGTVQVNCRLPGAGGSAASLTVAVYGDAPYGTTPTDVAEFQATPGFIASVNAAPAVSLVLHVGDIHSGKQFCTEAYDRSIFDLWSGFAAPLVYTPGDNEWSDCHKAAEGGGTYNATTGVIDYVVDSTGAPVDYAKGDPIANLALVRSIFFPTAGLSLGTRKQAVLSQAQLPDPAHPQDAAFVENVMWEQAKVLFVTINLPGGRTTMPISGTGRRSRRPRKPRRSPPAPAPICAGSTWRSRRHRRTGWWRW